MKIFPGHNDAILVGSSPVKQISTIIKLTAIGRQKDALTEQSAGKQKILIFREKMELERFFVPNQDPQQYWSLTSKC